MSSTMRIQTCPADDAAPKKPVRQPATKPAQDAFSAALARYRQTDLQKQQGQKTNVAQKADKSGAAKQAGNAKQAVFASRLGVNDGLQANRRWPRAPNAKDDGLEDTVMADGLEMRVDGMFVALRRIDDSLDEETAAMSGVDLGGDEYADLSLLSTAAEAVEESSSFFDVAQGRLPTGPDGAMWETDASAELSDVAGSLAPLAGDDGIFQVFLPNGGKLGVVVNMQPGAVRIHLNPDSVALGTRLRRRRVELQEELCRHTEKDVEITVL